MELFNRPRGGLVDRIHIRQHVLSSQPPLWIGQSCVHFPITAGRRWRKPSPQIELWAVDIVTERLQKNGGRLPFVILFWAFIYCPFLLLSHHQVAASQHHSSKHPQIWSVYHSAQWKITSLIISSFPDNHRPPSTPTLPASGGLSWWLDHSINQQFFKKNKIRPNSTIANLDTHHTVEENSHGMFHFFQTNSLNVLPVSVLLLQL